jgi:hypothetical protein
MEGCSKRTGSLVFRLGCVSQVQLSLVNKLLVIIVNTVNYKNLYKNVRFIKCILLIAKK